MNEWVLDIEADGFYDVATKAHVIVLQDVHSDECHIWRPSVDQDESDFFEHIHKYLDGCTIVGHNIFGYDLPLLRKLFRIDYFIGREDTWGGTEINHPARVNFVDTFQLSSFLWPDRPGGHSLANLAALAGSHKDDFKGPWDVWSQDMEAYCIQDCIGNAAVYRYLLDEARRKYGDVVC